MKRDNVISWQDYFMGLALLSAKRSKDPNTQVGACIVNQEKRIVGIGYNGFPQGISDDEFPWENNQEDDLGNKYPYVCHAELNAILNAKRDISDCYMYVTLFPCNECCKAIIQSQIKHIYYLEDRGFNSTSEQASKKMLDSVGISYTKIDKPNITL